MEKLEKIIKLLKPKYYNRITFIIIICGTSLLTKPIWIDILNWVIDINNKNFRKIELSIIGQWDSLLGLIVIIIGLFWNIRNRLIDIKAEEKREDSKNKYSEINYGQPEILIRNTAKPYLRYLKTENGLELSYELCFENSGSHAATGFKYNSVIQNLIINDEIIYSGPNSENNPPPKRIVTKDKFCQIFKLNNESITEQQIQYFINQFEINNVFILLELKYSFKDEVTGKKHSFIEKNKIKKDRVEIV